MNIFSKQLLNTITDNPNILYIYNEGKTKTNAVFSSNGWNYNTTSKAISRTTIDDIVTINGVSRTALHLYTWDNSSTEAGGASIVDTIGILGSELKEYRYLKIEVSYSTSGQIGANRLILYNDISKTWETSLDYINLGSGTVNNRISIFDIRNLSINNNTKYYVGARIQTSKGGTSITHNVYITKVWLEKEDI